MDRRILNQLDRGRIRLTGSAVSLALAAGCGGQPDAAGKGADKTSGGERRSGRRRDHPGRRLDGARVERGRDHPRVAGSRHGAGRDYELRISSAQGDLATLPGLIDAAIDAKAKVIVTLQDATLQVAVQRVKTVPVIFNLLSDPFAAGAGTSDSNHRPTSPGSTRRGSAIRSRSSGRR